MSLQTPKTIRILQRKLYRDTLEIDTAVVDRILNHVATATTSKIMRVYNKSELFEPRKRALAAWAKLIEDLVDPQAQPLQLDIKFTDRGIN